jgi:hypothetical protein
MSTTNPPPGQPQPDDHSPHGPPPQEVIDRGYEADVYDAKTVLSVPLLVIFFFVGAFSVVSVLFWVIAYPKSDGKAHPAAAEHSKLPLNERLKENYRGPKDGTGQPRLEPLKLRSGESRAITRPELPVSDGNSPELHPEDIRVSKDKFPALYTTGGNKVGLDKTMALPADKLKALFPVQKDPSNPVSSQHTPTAANAGRGADESLVTTPGPTKPDAAPPPKPKGEH